MKKRILIIVLVVLAAGAVALFLYFRSQRKSPTINTTGIVEGTEVNLSSKVSGRVSFLSKDEGDTVEQGEVVVRLENEDLKASVDLALAGIQKAKEQIGVYQSMVEASRANMTAAGADIQTVKAGAEKARYHMELAQKELSRSKKLHDEGLISDDQYDIAVTNADAASADYMSASSNLVSADSKKAAAAAQLQTAENQLEAAKADLKQAEANLAYNQARLEDTIIRSPITGTIAYKSVEQGETVSPGVTIVTIVDTNDLYVRTDIDETLIGNVALGAPATIRTEGNSGRTFEGTISEIGRYASFATQTDVRRGRQDIRTFRVRISVPSADGVLKPGMTVNVEIPKKAIG